MIEETSETKRYIVEKIFKATRYVVILSILGVFGISLVLYVDSFVLACQGVIHMVSTVGQESSQDTKTLAVSFIKLIDLFLIATAFYIIALGLYKVFIDNTLPLPDAIACHDFDDLKQVLMKVVTVILVILFLEKAIEWQAGWDILGLGAAMALVITAASWSTSQKH